MTLDIIIHHGYIITMEGPGCGIINDGAVGIKDDKIIAIGSTSEIMNSYTAHRYLNAEGKAVLPGFVDVHIHSSNAIVRGTSQDLPNSEWMFHSILPMLSAATTDDLVKASMVNLMEGVKSGTTTFGDFDIPMLHLVKNHIKLKTRAVVSDLINDLPRDVTTIESGELYPFDHSSGNEKLDQNRRLIEEYHLSNGGRITCRYGPQAADMCSEEMLREVKALAQKQNVDLFMHVSQFPEEEIQCNLRYGKRAIPFLDELGMLQSNLLAAHLTMALPNELKKVAQSCAGMCMCSNSIVMIDGKLPPAREFLDYGGTVGLGTDQAPGNNCNMMFNEMKFASILTKLQTGNPSVFPAWKILRMATIEAAKALGMDNQIGSLKPEKKADIIIINLMVPHMTPILERPVRNIIPNLVYAARGEEVETVIIDGDIIVDNRRLLTVDESHAIREANEAAKRLESELAQKEWAQSHPLTTFTNDDFY